MSGLYGVTITDQDVSLVIDVSETVKVNLENSSEMKNVNVGVKLTSSDLAGILKGSLPPLQAYLVSSDQPLESLNVNWQFSDWENLH